jgi:hypothetical protein
MEDTDLKHGQTWLDALSFLLIRVYALLWTWTYFDVAN